MLISESHFQKNKTAQKAVFIEVVGLEIVLDEWDDAMRRKLLTFSTGSDRAPINGLKSMKFYIVLEGGEDDERLPSSHTCFNQLCMPQYSTKEILRAKLTQAIEEAQGFGMV